MGGNSLLDPALPPTIANQFRVTRGYMEPIAELMAAGERLVLTHGNGPQVGHMLLRTELARSQVHDVPLDSLVADSQGELGYMVQRCLREALQSRGLDTPMATLVTEIECDPSDPAFARPTKPVGQFYSAAEAEELRTTRGWDVVDDAGRGWRRVVPSPQPKAIVQLGVIRQLIDSGVTVVCCGGGGIPVCRQSDGRLRGLEAVIDKDRASALLAIALGVPRFVVTTGVDVIYRDWRKPTQQALPQTTVAELRELLQAGQFPPGSMGPKVEAAIDFLEAGGEVAIICRPEDVARALRGEAGTHVRLR
jgi:carbamate kinase